MRLIDKLLISTWCIFLSLILGPVALHYGWAHQMKWVPWMVAGIFMLEFAWFLWLLRKPSPRTCSSTPTSDPPTSGKGPGKSKDFMFLAMWLILGCCASAAILINLSVHEVLRGVVPASMSLIVCIAGTIHVLRPMRTPPTSGGGNGRLDNFKTAWHHRLDRFRALFASLRFSLIS